MSSISFYIFNVVRWLFQIIHYVEWLSSYMKLQNQWYLKTVVTLIKLQCQHWGTILSPLHLQCYGCTFLTQISNNTNPNCTLYQPNFFHIPWHQNVPVPSMTNNISLSKQVHLGTINTRQGPNRQHWIEHMRRELTHFTFLANYQCMIYHASGAANDLNFHWIGKLGL